MYTYVFGGGDACGDRKRTSEHLELELQMAVSQPPNTQVMKNEFIHVLWESSTYSFMSSSMDL
ncbi:hypothetical protein I79_013439 [Cricetulus griseus]|uniref:Uncharacterized protein n=1 Tax=Cricetulus griseus TaxID=10029 RepID=G3HRJ6_CRIGR|nr:hypothetical protein I79_013439 [Cricetulus griseus]